MSLCHEAVLSSDIFTHTIHFYCQQEVPKEGCNASREEQDEEWAMPPLPHVLSPKLLDT